MAPELLTGAQVARSGAAIEAVEQVELGRDLAPLPRPGKGVLRQSATDPDARFLRARGGRFVLGYTGEIGRASCRERVLLGV